ncbi:septum formation initiator family protein [Paracoccaceae bacterium]|nr:septum formation initiator family protein [Paracoccaceae bacterium]
MFKSLKILEITVSAVCLILCFYFIIASFKGEFGVSSKYQLLAKEKALTKELKFINEENKAIKNKIRRLSDTALDLELLDQQARKILGLIGEDELIVF